MTGRDSGYSQLDHGVAPAKCHRIGTIHRTKKWGGERGVLKAEDCTANESEGVEWVCRRPAD